MNKYPKVTYPPGMIKTAVLEWALQHKWKYGYTSEDPSPGYTWFNPEGKFYQTPELAYDTMQQEYDEAHKVPEWCKDAAQELFGILAVEDTASGKIGPNYWERTVPKLIHKCYKARDDQQR